MEMDKQYTIEDLLDILVQLRGENGCPWDKVQTHESLKKNMIEETYEAIDALDQGNDAMFCNELGDVLLQVAFHAVIAKERGAFDFNDILYEICTKLISRHTHVFGAEKAASAEEALATWEKNKKKEKKQSTLTEAMEDVPKGLPALMRAEKVQKKAASAGFDWEDAAGVLEKVAEEAREVSEVTMDAERCEEEFGDLLFVLVNLGRHLKVTPETALAKATNKFVRRFSEMEALATAQNKVFSELSASEMDDLWKKVKQKS
ncbi:MAG: nucleoside triphosphate pyrophosphohydrolase [Ruminococcaceae bacterium]|nr:nucleoside triphosphate pyrophosphohydrolase [Oscillospiraceae bacterium]